MVVNVNDPAKNLTLEMKDLESPEAGKLTFSAAVRASDLNLKSSSRCGSSACGSSRTRRGPPQKPRVHLDCEVSQRLETKPGVTFPEMVLTFKGRQGGSVLRGFADRAHARPRRRRREAIGDATHKLLKQIKPSLERDLVEKANAAIVKAASDKEVRVGFSSLMKK